MLPSKNRLKKKKDFSQIFKAGRSIRVSRIIVRVKNNGLRESRFAFIISKKVISKATERNKTKRRLSEIVSDRIDRIRSGFDVVFITLSGIGEFSFRQLEQIVDNALIKSNLFNDDK